MAKRCHCGLVLGLAWLAVFSLAGRLEARKYRFHDLGTLGGSEASAYAINGQGQVAGWAENSSGMRRAFRWTPGRQPPMENLGTLSGTYSEAYGLNNAGMVVGKSDGYAFFWSPGNMQNLGTLDGGISSQANSVNYAGTLVGYDLFTGTYGTNQRPFWWSSGPVQPMLLPGGYISGQANAINQAGQVSGLL